MEVHHPYLVVALAAALMSGIAPAEQAPTGSSSSKTAKPEQRVKAAPPPGIEQNTYRSATFGFSYRIPYGWVERTKDMQGEATDPAKGQVLLAVFERPPDASGETVNSAVVIAAESASSYPGLMTAADYLGPLTDIITSKGFKPVEEPYEYTAGGRQLVRADFSKEMGQLTMRQSTLVCLTKGNVVSFTFIGGSEDEMDELMERLSFAGGTKPATRK